MRVPKLALKALRFLAEALDALFLVGGVFFGISSVFTRVARRLRVEILAREQREKAARCSGYHAKLAELEAAKETDREKVLEVYAKAKAMLDERRREVAFLAADGTVDGFDVAVWSPR